MNPSSKRNLKIFQLCALSMAMVLTLVGSLITLKASFMLGIFNFAGAIGWIGIYVFTNHKVRKTLFSNLFEDPVKPEPAND
ncbi:hypothetical protein V0M98_33850 (plasmid) [Pseudomonas silesiensis]|uniref:hypothetical protein n=1 Tax=Pseudomonas silesiensis TaxID=1853130 RepID=UPI0030CE1425